MNERTWASPSQGRRAEGLVGGVLALSVVPICFCIVAAVLLQRYGSPEVFSRHPPLLLAADLSPETSFGLSPDGHHPVISGGDRGRARTSNRCTVDH